MYIESRMDGRTYLVDKPTKIDSTYYRINLNQNGVKIYGSGNKIFLFEAAGKAGTSFVLDLIYADSISSAEEMVQERYKDRLGLTLIRKSNKVEEVIDHRNER